MSDIIEDDSPTSPPPQPKRSLFKRPQWAQDSSTFKPATEGADDMFSRSQSYSEIIAERERQRKARAEKKKEKARVKGEKKSSELSREYSGGPSSVKRRRVSDEDDDRDKATLPWSGSSTKASHEGSELRSEISASRAESKEPNVTVSKAAVIELGDSSDEEVKPVDELKIITQPNTIPDSDSESDPEFARLKRQAREKRRLQETNEQQRANAPKTYIPGSIHQSETPPPLFDPVVQLLITSQIPNTTPLIVSRRLSQRLQEVREAWCAKQGFDETYASTVFLTYKLRKLYDPTTCKTLGVHVDCDGKVIPPDDPFAERTQHDTKIHIEAVTKEIWERLKKEKGKGSRSLALLNDSSNQDAENTPGVNEGVMGEVQEEASIRLLLKAKGFKDAKIKVRPSTKFSAMINGARVKFGEQDATVLDRQIQLEFDGDILEPPDGQVKDTDIDDKDCINVYIK